MNLLKRILIWSSIGLLTLLLLCISAIGLFIGWMKWSGDRNLKIVQAELHAKGEKLTFEELVPTQPPDSANFFADPMWQELKDLVQVTRDNGFGKYQTWEPRLPAEKQTINRWLTPFSTSEREQIIKFVPQAFSKLDQSQLNGLVKQFQSTIQEINSPPSRLSIVSILNQHLAETKDLATRKQIAQLMLNLIQPASTILSRISELAMRPSAYFPSGYRDGFSPASPYVPSLQSMSRLLAWRSTAELEIGDIAAAASDTLTILRLSSVYDSEPLTISHLIQISILNHGLSEVNSGIEHHQWKDADLVDFQYILKKKNLYASLSSCLRGERVYFDKVLHSKNADQTVLFFLIKLDAQYCEGDYFSAIQDRLDFIPNAHKGINATTLPADSGLVSLRDHPFISTLHATERLALPAIDAAIRKTVEMETQLSQSLIACALERYHLAHGSYPASLDALLPMYLSSIPKESTTGNPMHYRLQSDGTFLLWSPGWKLKTREGKSGELEGGGDIVWNQPISRILRN